MARFRLRYQSTNLELPVGEFKIGRSSSCSLAVTDVSVSRRHAVLHVGPDAVVVEDLGSHNGVLVNGVRIDAPRRLAHMDRVYLGSQELVLIEPSKLTQPPEIGEHVVCESCGGINGAARRYCGDCGKRLKSMAGATLKDRNEVDEGLDVWGEPEHTGTLGAVDVIEVIATKALSMGRFEEAERILLPHLESLLERALRPLPHDAPDGGDPNGLLAAGTTCALQLAEGLGDMKWVDWVFRIHTATGRLMDAPTIETLHALVRSHNYHRRKHLRTYLHTLRTRTADYGAGEQFLVRRLEELDRLISPTSSKTDLSVAE